MPDIKEFEAFVDKLADAAGSVVRKYYRHLESIESKADASAVTVADRKVEETLRQIIQNHYPDHGIQGEEFGSVREEAPYRWVIDPIDGTTSFMIGRPTFGTLIALMYEGAPILGVIDQPISGERWMGGNEARLNKKLIHTRECGALSNAVLCTTGPNYFTPKQLTAFNKLSDQARFTVYGGDCYSYGLLASGHVDVVVEAGLKAHDFCAFIPLIEKAGGVITDWKGSPLAMQSAGNVVAAGDRKVHAQIIEILKQYT